MRLALAIPLLLSACWLTTDEMLAKMAEAKGGGVSSDTAPPRDTGVGSPTDTGGPTTPTTPSTTSPTEPTAFECADEDLGTRFGESIASGTTKGASDDLVGACLSGAGGGDIAYKWTAPGTGCWTFEMDHPGWDAGLYFLDACDGDVLACVETAAWVEQTPEQTVTGLRVEGGTDLLVVVDGSSTDDAGAHDLSISVGTEMPIDVDLGSLLGSHEGSNEDDDLDFLPSGCSFNSGADVLHQWTAPVTGRYRFRLLPVGTTFDTVLSLHIPCSDDSLSCEDTFLPFEGGGELIEAQVHQGERLVIRVAGYQPPYESAATGDYLLEISVL